MGLLIAAVYAGSSQADTATRVALTTASYLTFLLTMCGAMFADTLGSILEHADVYAEQRSQSMVRALPYFIGKSLVVLLPYFVRLRINHNTALPPMLPLAPLRCPLAYTCKYPSLPPVVMPTAAVTDSNLY